MQMSASLVLSCSGVVRWTCLPGASGAAPRRAAAAALDVVGVSIARLRGAAAAARSHPRHEGWDRGGQRAS